ncbi:hypothetical protein AAON49_04995 [Pseudotenacibaculum sp. MALMAid0570]|uniref:hypothetical protein n=1 Tax=Pseudotenacibaculum sp. MALMAid0570 TaxID=3143938 RepID=UPI0032DEACCA
MHKKLAADLTSLAHSILQMKNKEDVFALKNKAHEVYEKLSVLAFVEEYINNTPNPEHTKEEILEKIEQVAAEVETPKEEIVKHDLEEVTQGKTEEVVEESSEEVQEENLEAENTDFVSEEPEKEEVVSEAEKEVVAEEVEEVAIESEDLFSLESQPEEEKETPSLDEELQDTIAVDVVADLFENTPKKSLNDKLQGDIQIGLNDRIAFVKNLFDGSQEDFNRVVSQLNTLKTEKEAKKFINKMVKPDYDWTEKEEFEERFIAIVERKFA